MRKKDHMANALPIDPPSLMRSGGSPPGVASESDALLALFPELCSVGVASHVMFWCVMTPISGSDNRAAAATYIHVANTWGHQAK